jgi:hypothetical protein
MHELHLCANLCFLLEQVDISGTLTFVPEGPNKCRQIYEGSIHIKVGNLGFCLGIWGVHSYVGMVCVPCAVLLPSSSIIPSSDAHNTPQLPLPRR